VSETAASLSIRHLRPRRDRIAPSRDAFRRLGAALAPPVGVSKGEMFFHALVLSALPGTAMRIAAAVAVGSGASGAVLGCLAYVRAG